MNVSFVLLWNSRINLQNNASTFKKWWKICVIWSTKNYQIVLLRENQSPQDTWLLGHIGVCAARISVMIQPARRGDVDTQSQNISEIFDKCYHCKITEKYFCHPNPKTCQKLLMKNRPQFQKIPNEILMILMPKLSINWYTSPYDRLRPVQWPNLFRARLTQRLDFPSRITERELQLAEAWSKKQKFNFHITSIWSNWTQPTGVLRRMTLGTRCNFSPEAVSGLRRKDTLAYSSEDFQIIFMGTLPKSDAGFELKERRDRRKGSFIFSAELYRQWILAAI